VSVRAIDRATNATLTFASATKAAVSGLEPSGRSLLSWTSTAVNGGRASLSQCASIDSVGRRLAAADLHERNSATSLAHGRQGDAE
jgi:hypothetical protein